MKLLDSIFRVSLFNNVGLKITAVVLALLTWLAITQITSFEQKIQDVPVIIKHDEGVSLLDHDPRSFTVVLRGTRTEMLKLDDRYVQIEIDLRGAPFQEDQTYTVKPKNVIFPGSGNVVSIVPDRLSIRLDQPDSKRVAVQVKTVNEPPEGYILESVVCVPETVLIKGSRKRLVAIDQVFTEALDLNGKTQSFEQRAKIQLPTSSWDEPLDPNSVLMQVNISENFVEKTFTNVVIGLLRDKEASDVVGLDPEAVTVTVRGNPKLLAELSVKDLAAYVNLNAVENLSKKAVKKEVNLDFHDRVSLISIVPKTVWISAKKRDENN